MTGKITMTISVGIVSLILVMLMFTQFKTVDKTDITAIETMRETELRSELSSWKNKYDEVEKKVLEQDAKISEYKDELKNDENTSSTLEGEVKEAEAYIGLTALKGQGIIVTLSDKDIYNIEYDDILRLVNELNIAGAEAISVNDERIVAMSDITLVNNRIVLVNTRKISGPYVIKAIGDKKYFESALNIKGGYIDSIAVNGKGVEYKLEDNITIPAYEEKEKLEMQYAKQVKEE